jgi:hypothetical protein
VVTEKLTGKSAVEDYFSSLLFDTQSPTISQDTQEPAFRFARVDPGYEVMSFWTHPLSPAQQFCADLILLSRLKNISGEKLRHSMLNAIHMVQCE